ncbi:LysM peptidoglycan-binding domain-containing protein [Endozoicomonas sp. SM1973]|uniref:LysM peptidoglycan-binding domain-containing protein n=1 Tax=Spartinivicinus marinus TaxID=2994442 RepID=A0A853ICP3_9GAMM|nr:FimV/HubP family polar landmark protein [Spartinivicinus marinus]MCX4030191.1 LysM peptidoglycan-binding domain-containing protein [Spartinivicinus marinus]NYZ67834.1 LysM peptidoglycan-binding domain-containing protein [Spartinivicinus marinus]
MKKIAAALMASCVISLSHADKVVRLDRYTLQKAEPTADQQHLLSVMVNMRFPSQVKTVGDALEWVLMRSGYRLEQPSEHNPYLFSLYSLKLPSIHRRIGPATLEDVLNVLAGDGYQLAINPVIREIGYTIKPDFKRFIDKNTLAKAKVSWSLRRKMPVAIVESGTIPIKQGYTPHSRHYLVNAGDSLSKIAERYVRSFLSLDQVQVAIYQANPMAFYSKNLNNLRPGVTLSIPSVAVIEQHTKGQAKKIVKEHFALWRNANKTNQG